VRLGMGVMSIGPRPTVNLGDSVEVHLLDYSGDLYGKHLRVHLVQRLRGIEKFANVEALQTQIKADVENARQQLAVWLDAH